MTFERKPRLRFSTTTTASTFEVGHQDAHRRAVDFFGHRRIELVESDTEVNIEQIRNVGGSVLSEATTFVTAWTFQAKPLDGD